ncbi:MAG TPA: flagellar export chaperone FliS [Clostridiales bacterium]|nr:flagellar export chaperone FliS [Clostridiales bacterium]
MAMFNPYQQYEKQSVMTASPGELTLMLYNGCIKFIKMGIKYIEEGNIGEANNAIQKAQDIINELAVTLDMEYEIAEQMYLLYEYMERRLIEANISKDMGILHEVEELIVELRDTWAEVIKLNRQQRYGGYE